MAFVQNGIRYAIKSVAISGGLVGRVGIAADRQEETIWYDIQFTGSGNYVADAYELIRTLPEWIGAEFDGSDIAQEFPGSGNAVLYVHGVDLAALKEEAKTRITIARDMDENNGFEAYGKTIDSDARSIARINTAVQSAQAIGESFVIEWTCADNSTITLDYAQMVCMPVLMAQAGSLLHEKARALKAQIDAATTPEEINAVQW